MIPGKTMTKKYFLLLLVCNLAAVQNAVSQRTGIYDEPDATYRQAVELYKQEKFGAARHLFLQAIDRIDDPKDALHANATLYAAICAAEINEPDAINLLQAYIDKHPAHHGKNLAWYHMGNVNFRQRNYEEAAKWYDRLHARDIDQDAKAEFIFNKAYSHFMTGSYNTAAQLFSQISSSDTEYFNQATYYAGHIAYVKGNYEAAMESFQLLTGDNQFGPMVPYYILHIYHLQEQYDELIAHASTLRKEASPRDMAEIARLTGEAHYQRSQYREAIPFLEEYLNHRRGMGSNQDHYQLGYALYMSERYEEAIPHLERAIADDDQLSQSAYYHLASAYIETGQKRFARNAFMQAYRIGLQENIARESLFHYALLSFELSYDPHNEAILAFQKYISEYPGSPRMEEALGHLADLYFTTSNYKDALSSLEKTALNTPRLREAYQRVSFYRGVELFNNGDFEAAINHFEKTRRFQENRDLEASAMYWMAEALYRRGQFNEAIRLVNAFMSVRAAGRLPVYNQAYYLAGYAHFKQKQYNQAISKFREYITATGEDQRMINDAMLRIADSYFITKQYQPAMDYYSRAIQMDVVDTDYAVFQQGLVYGITGNYIEKIATLESLISDYPQSSFVDDSKYEIANSWLTLNNNSRARNYFYQIINEHPNSSYVQSAKLKTGLIYFNDNEDMKALDMFKKVVEQYPGTPQAEEALASIRNIYVSLDRVDEFVRFTEDVGIADISTAQEDTLVYRAAENRYMQGDCAHAITSFTNYLNRFPNGVFATHAHFYRSECLFRTNERQQALDGYLYVIDRPRSKFLENALLRASSIEYHGNNYEKALGHFRHLETIAEIRSNILVARKGIMRCLYHMERFQGALEAATVVLQTDKLPDDGRQEALLIQGLSAMATGNKHTARTALGKVTEIAQNRRAAEAMYNLALITFREGNYAEAEEQIFDYINKLSAYDYWLAKIFLLLADVYIETGNTFQARHTLESIIENHDGEELRRQAEERLRFIDNQQQ